MLWWRGGRALSGDSNTAVVNAGVAGRFNDGPSLVIQAVSMRDLGDFTCLARNGGTSTRAKVFSLELAGPQHLENVTVETVQINSGGPRVTLRCPLPLSSPPAEFAVLWYRWEGEEAGQDLRPFYVFNSDQAGLSSVHLRDDTEELLILEPFRAWKPTIPYAIKNQRGASKIPWGSFAFQSPS